MFKCIGVQFNRGDFEKDGKHIKYDNVVLNCVRTPVDDTELGQLCEQIKINSARIPSVLGGKSPKELIGKEITVENIMFKGRSVYSRIYATV